MTILLTTHYMEEAAQLADRVGIVDEGRLIAEAAPSELIEQSLPAYVLEIDGRGCEPPQGLNDGSLVERHGDRIYVYDDDESALRGWLAEFCLGSAQLRPTTLEDVFLKMTGRGLHE
jgi:lipooligosaccharide transport system ATP-binding protein